MPESSPWNGIAVPDADFNVRQVTGKTAVPCFWGRDKTGACLFIIELQGEHAEQYRKNAVAVRGIGMDIRFAGANMQRLVLTLEQEINRDLFEGLCLTLTSALESAKDSASSLAIALTHVRRWKTFLAGRGQRLEPEEVRGLFAELTFLMEMLDRSVPSAKAIGAWLGPEGSHQDFIFSNKSVEIKSLSGHERSTVRISSEDQLESLNDALFLRIYRLISLTGPGLARSLNAIIAEIHGRLEDAEAVEEFDRKLFALGYVPLPDYDEPAFIVGDIATYRIETGFPRLVRSRLPVGIDKVAYDIRLESMVPFQCAGGAIFGGD